jgi:hypothetical protein
MALFGWHPENWPDDLPAGSSEVQIKAAIARLQRAVASGADQPAWDAAILAVLNGSHRPSDLAASVVQLLEIQFSNSTQID